MADFAGAIDQTSYRAHQIAGGAVPNGIGPDSFQVAAFPDFPSAGPVERILPSRRTPIVTNAGAIHEVEDFYWFERVHNFPTFFELGNILTTITRSLEIYNAYREDARTVSAFDNNADAGVTIPDLPALPYELMPSSGLLMTVTISTTGPPSLDGTLDFTLDIGEISVPISGSRVVMFSFEPESPIAEELLFLTDIIVAADGTEQRIRLRKNPRQVFTMRYLFPEGDTRRRAQTLLKGWHQRVFGVPVWTEARQLQADMSTGATEATVDPDFADFRVGSLAIVWRDEDNFDALEIESIGASSITFSSPVTHDFVAGETLVMPLRVAYTDASIPGRRYLSGLQENTLTFRVIDNDADLADDSDFPSYNGRVLLTEANLADGGDIDEQLYRQLEQIDTPTGIFTQFSDWLSSQPITTKGFLGDSPERVWQVRKLLHALRGSQKSFYLPTFYYDLVVTEALASGSTLMSIENIGYADYINGQEPFKSIWILLKDGSSLFRDIESAEVVDTDTEQLTVDTAWASTIEPEDIDRVCFIRLVRIADDIAAFEHRYAGNARITINVKGTPN